MKKFRPTNVKKSMIESKALDAISHFRYAQQLLVELEMDLEEYDLNLKIDKANKKNFRSMGLVVTKLDEAIVKFKKLIK